MSGGENGRGRPAGAARTDRRQGMWGGRSIARVVESPDGMTILVGKSARDNDILSLKLGRPYDVWMHVAGESGSHIVVLNDDKLSRLPRETQDLAAGFAAGYSKARGGGNVTVHVATCADVSKQRGAPAGQVTLRRFSKVKARPQRLD